MFSLIAAIIGIVVAAMAAIATVYYIGSAADAQAVTAQTAKLVNEASQIHGAIVMYGSDHAGNTISDLQDLVNGNYLKTIPQNGWSVSNQNVVRPISTEGQCKDFNKRMGYGAIVPSCSDSTYDNVVVCCQ